MTLLKTNIAIIAILLLFTTCCRSSNPQIPSNRADVDTVGKNLIEYNKLCIDDEKKEIDYYIDSIGKREKGVFTLTEDGVYFREIVSYNGKKIENGSTVSIAYSLELLNGTICSQSSNGKAKTFKVGKREVEKGLDIAIVGHSRGDEFEIIIPYNMAWGVTGDRNCIPPRAPILYRVKIL